MFLALRRRTESLFPSDRVERLRREVRKALQAGGYGDALPRKGDEAQALDVRLVQALLKACGDPDHYAYEWAARGVWLGSKERPPPRARALYERKTSWPLDEVVEGETGSWPRITLRWPTTGLRWRSNFVKKMHWASWSPSRSEKRSGGMEHR